MLLDTPLCDFGWPAPNFNLKDAKGNEVSLQQSLNPKGLLVMFICNHCPYVQRIASRLVEDTNVLLAEGINVVAIMSNDFQQYPADRPEMMAKFSEQYGFKFPYLVDETQAVGKSYGAICTPDFFGFNGEGRLQYRGRLDNSSGNSPDARIPELVDAMRLIAHTSKGPKTQFASMGCSIKWRD